MSTHPNSLVLLDPQGHDNQQIPPLVSWNVRALVTSTRMLKSFKHASSICVLIKIGCLNFLQKALIGKRASL